MCHLSLYSACSLKHTAKQVHHRRRRFEVRPANVALSLCVASSGNENWALTGRKSRPSSLWMNVELVKVKAGWIPQMLSCHSSIRSTFLTATSQHVTYAVTGQCQSHAGVQKLASQQCKTRKGLWKNHTRRNAVHMIVFLGEMTARVSISS